MFGLTKKTECDKISEKLSMYIDGQLSAKDIARVESHLHECETCAVELAELRVTVELMGQVEDVPAPRSFAIDPAKVGVPERKQEERSWPLRWMRPALAISVALFLVMLFVDLGTSISRNAATEVDAVFEGEANVLSSGGGVDWHDILRIVEWGWGAVVVSFAIAFIYVSWRRHRGYPDHDDSNDILR